MGKHSEHYTFVERKTYLGTRAILELAAASIPCVVYQPDRLRIDA